MTDEGSNAGVTGLLCLQGQSGVKFVGDALGWEAGLGVGVFDDAGRADSIWGNKIPLTSGGTITLKGMTNLDGQPTPNDYRGERGSLTLTQTTGVTMTLTVMVTNSKFVKSTKEDQLWDFVHVCAIVAAPALAGWGGTNAAATQSYGDKELWAGMSKTLDPQTLQSGATQRWRIWGIGDNDAAEKTKIDSHLAALSAPYSGMKLRPCTFTRLSTNVCISETTWGLTDTAEDVINAASSTTLDTHHVASTGTTAAFNGAPSAPSGDSFVLWSSTTKEYNDAMTLHTADYRLLTPLEAITFPASHLTIDISDLTSFGAEVKTFTFGNAAPAATDNSASGVQKVSTTITRINEVLSQVEYGFAKDTPQQKAEQDASYTDVDPQGLETKKAAALMDSTPSTPAGTVERSTRTKNLTNDHTLTIVEGGLRSTADDETFGRTKIEIENNGASPKTGQETYTAEIITTGASFVAPSAPSTGMVCISYFDIPLTKSTTTNKSIRVYVWSLTTNLEKLQQPRYSNQVDPNGLDTVVHSATVWDGTSAPGDPALTGIRSGLKLVYKEDIGIPSHPATLIRVYRHEKNDSIDKRVLPHTWLLADPSNITSHGEVAALNSTPATPGGYKSRGITGFYQNGTDLLNVKQYGLRDEADDVIHGDTVARTRVFEGTTLDGASLLASTNAANIIAASILSTYKNNTTFEGATVRKLHDGLAEIILHTRDDQIIVRYRFWGTGQQLTPAYYDGSDVYVFVGDIYQIGSTFYFELFPSYHRGGRGELTIDRRINGSSVDLQSGLFDSSNNAAFLGLAAGLVAYIGPTDGDVNILVAAPRASRIVYGFEVDSNYHIDKSTVSMGWQRTTTDISAVTKFSWVKASDLGLTAALIDAQDYSGFIS